MPHDPSAPPSLERSTSAAFDTAEGTDPDGARSPAAAPDPTRPRRRRWRPGIEPRSRTAAAVAIGLVGVMVAERAATIAPVALPLLLATGLIGSLVRRGWGGPGWTWVGAAGAEAVGALAYLATRPPADAQWDPLVPLFLAGGVALFAGLFFAGFAVVSIARRILAPRTAALAIVLAVVALVALALLTIVVGPAPTTAPTDVPAAEASLGRVGGGRPNVLALASAATSRILRA